MDRILIVGHSPSKKNIRNSPTIKRLHRWLDECGITTYAFTNLSPVPCKKLVKEDLCLDGLDHGKIITLGGEVSKFMEKAGIQHFAAPHPSPLNRNLNDISFEKKTIKELSVYIRG
tara:strand:+ start:160 stop:507 length:348 start_codon:yes stop_codon:yes gene_type:complete